jgi:IS5 family transposase
LLRANTLLTALPVLLAKLNAAVERDPGHLGDALGLLPEQMSVYLDRGYDTQTTRQKLKSRGLEPMISGKG